MKHIDFETLNLLLDKELSQEDTKQWESHIQACPECQKQWESLSGVSHSIQTFSKQLVPDKALGELWENISQDLKKPELVEEPSVSWAERIRALFLRPAFSVAFALFLVVGTLIISQQKTMANNEAVINSVAADQNMVLIFKTQEHNVTVIWLFDEYKEMDLNKGEENDEISS